MPKINPPYECPVRLRRLSGRYKKQIHIAVQRKVKGRWLRLAVYDNEAEALKRFEEEFLGEM